MNLTLLKPTRYILIFGCAMSLCSLVQATYNTPPKNPIKSEEAKKILWAPERKKIGKRPFTGKPSACRKLTFNRDIPAKLRFKNEKKESNNGCLLLTPERKNVFNPKILWAPQKKNNRSNHPVRRKLTFENDSYIPNEFAGRMRLTESKQFETNLDTFEIFPAKTHVLSFSSSISLTDYVKIFQSSAWKGIASLQYLTLKVERSTFEPDLFKLMRGEIRNLANVKHIVLKLSQEIANDKQHQTLILFLQEWKSLQPSIDTIETCFTFNGQQEKLSF